MNPLASEFCRKACVHWWKSTWGINSNWPLLSQVIPSLKHLFFASTKLANKNAKINKGALNRMMKQSDNRERIIKKAEDAPVHIHPIGAVSKGQDGKDITEMGLMYKEGAVAFSDDGLPIQDGGVMRIALEYSNVHNP